MGLVACEKEKADTPTDQGRDIYYTVSDGSSVSGFSGTTAHINTNDEFDALLDRFCNFAQNGGQVMFCGSHPASHTKASSSDTPTSITTTDREELKVWMKEMEKAGKTVQITYNEDNGTWNGRAYANLRQDISQNPQMYTGTLDFVPTPVLEEPPLGGSVWAMHVGNDSTLIITVHGMMMWNENETPTDDMALLIGAEVILEGVVNTHTDLNGDTFLTLDINVDVEEQ
jgi:hypothetical protein